MYSSIFYGVAAKITVHTVKCTGTRRNFLSATMSYPSVTQVPFFPCIVLCLPFLLSLAHPCEKYVLLFWFLILEFQTFNYTIRILYFKCSRQSSSRTFDNKNKIVKSSVLYSVPTNSRSPPLTLKFIQVIKFLSSNFYQPPGSSCIFDWPEFEIVQLQHRLFISVFHRPIQIMLKVSYILAMRWISLWV